MKADAESIGGRRAAMSPAAAWATVGAILAVLAGWPWQPALGESPREVVYEAIAGELLDGVARLAGAGGTAALAGPRYRIAVWPFRADDTPIPKPGADAIQAGVVAALSRRNAGLHELVAREAILTIIADLEETGELDDATENPIPALLDRVREVDILVRGHMRRAGAGIDLWYEAWTMDGTLAAATQVRRLTLEPGEAQAARWTLEQAVAQAARYFADRVPGMTELRLGGVRFEASGIQPPFGPYLEDSVRIALKDAFSDVLTDRTLIVHGPELGEECLGPIRGMPVAAGALDAERCGGGEGAFLLTGTYWIWAAAVEIRLTLEDSAGRSESWKGFARLDSLPPGVALRPEGDLGPLQWDKPGPIAFKLRSARGDDPSYGIGETLDLLLRVDRDAWVHCFYRQADRVVVPIFPNSHHRETRLEGGVLYTIPGDLLPFALRFTAPAGVELVKCFAATRDISAEVATTLGGASLEPLPPDADATIATLFRSIPGAGLSEASLVITVRDEN